MSLEDYKESLVAITFTKTTSYSYEDDFAIVAKKLGINQKALAALLDDEDTPDVDDITAAAWKRTIREADLNDETYEIEDFGHSG